MRLICTSGKCDKLLTKPFRLLDLKGKRLYSGLIVADSIPQLLGREPESRKKSHPIDPYGSKNKGERIRAGFDGDPENMTRGMVMNRLLKSMTVSVIGLVCIGVLGDPAEARSKRPSCLPNCQNAILQGADLRGLNLKNANFDNAILQGADLKGANLQGASLQGANLSNANLQNVNLKNANLYSAHLHRANLTRTNLQGASLSKSNLHYVAWSKTICPSGQKTNTGCDVPREAPVKTIGLWHETIPAASWSAIGSYQEFLQGAGAPNGRPGFQAYAADYVGFVQHLQSAAQSHGFGLGPIYFEGGDPGPDNVWNSDKQKINTAFKYLSPNPATGQRPMLNQYVVEPLGKLGVQQFGLVVALNSWDNSSSQWSAPWGWVPNNADPNPPNGMPTNVNPSAVDLFKLVYELNQELKTSYTTNNTPSNERLYITLLGFDNEGFNVVPPDSSCTVSSGTVADSLWISYVKAQGFSTASTPQWGITGQSPPFEDFCDNGHTPIPASSRQFGFIEYYNVPGEANAVLTFDHPGFVPCSAPWAAGLQIVKGVLDASCNNGFAEPYYQIAYGTVTPSFSSHPVAGLTRTIPPDDPTSIYKQTLNGWSAIWNGITQSEVWQRTPANGALSQAFIQEAYSMLNAPSTGSPSGTLTTLSQSSLYCTGSCNTGTGTPVEGTQWMLSIENFSSSYQTVKDSSPTQPEMIPISAVDTTRPFSSIALKYGPNAPFDLTADKSQYILSHPTTASGTYEAFGGWGVDNLASLMEYMSQQNSLLNHFMIYEYAFVQLNDTKPSGPSR